MSLLQRIQRHRSAESELHELVEVFHDDDKALVDFVCVLGAGATREHAFARNLGDIYVNWAEKQLPSYVPCRVMLANFKAPFSDRKGDPATEISKLAEGLLKGLQEKRAEGSAVDRPIIFCAHSFGGNVVVEALCSNRKRNYPFYNITKNTKDIFFFGTPFRGTRWATVLYAYAAVHPGRRPSEVVKCVMKNSQWSKDNVAPFEDWADKQGIKIHCAYELYRTDYLLGTENRFIGIMVVSQSSACIKGCVKIPIRANHSRINKFHGSDNPDFKTIIDFIQKAVSRYEGEKKMNQGKQMKQSAAFSLH